MKCFCFTVCVCRCFLDLLLWLTVLLLGCFYFLNLSLFVTVWKKKKCTCYGIIVNMKGCVEELASFWRLHLKNRADLSFLCFFLLVSTVSRLRMTHNQVEMQHADRRLLSLHAVFLSASVLLAWTLVHLHKGKVSNAVVTLGNILLPVQVIHIRLSCYRCHGLHFP